MPSENYNQTRQTGQAALSHCWPQYGTGIVGFAIHKHAVNICILQYICQKIVALHVTK